MDAPPTFEVETDAVFFQKVIDKSVLILYIVHVAYEIYAALAQ